MIRLRNMTPDPYYSQSRDFQLIGRLFDLVLNSVKTNTDQVYNVQLNYDTDEKLLDLMAMTLGFKSRHEYNSRQLRSICSCFADILRKKGSKDAVLIAAKALLNAEGLVQGYSNEDIVHVNEDNTEITVYLPPDLVDNNLFNDLLSYILPAGVGCNIVRAYSYTYTADSEEYQTVDNVRYIKGVNDNTNAGTIINDNYEDTDYGRANPVTNDGKDHMQGLFVGGQIFIDDESRGDKQ